MHYYQHHIGDFIKDTANLDDHQLATYLRLLWAYYDTELPIAGDIEDIAFAMRSDGKTVRLLLRHYFVEQDDGWHHSRCDRELEDYRAKKDKARNSASARWNNAKAMRTHTERSADASVFDANQEPITNNQEPIDINTKPRAKRKPDPGGSLSISDLVAEGVDERHAIDWMMVRKDKGAKSLTQTAWLAVKTEAAKIGLTPAQAVEMSASNSWRGFNASWVANQKQTGSGGQLERPLTPSERAAYASSPNLCNERVKRLMAQELQNKPTKVQEVIEMEAGNVLTIRMD